MRCTSLSVAFAAAFTTVSAIAPAAAQSYPAQPVKLMVGFAAGGPSDIVARAFADHAAKALGQPVIVENKPGANAVLATEAVAAARPGTLSYATPGQGSSPHLATEQFRRLTGMGLVHVPYKGAAPAVTDLMGGQVDLSFATVGSVLPQLKAGKLRALAVASRQRSALLPEVPTFDEAGVKGFVVDTWYGLLAPAGTPPEALRVLTREASDFARSPAVRERLASAGLEPQGLCGEPFAAQIARELDANARLARELNLKAE